MDVVGVDNAGCMAEMMMLTKVWMTEGEVVVDGAGGRGVAGVDGGGCGSCSCSFEVVGWGCG